MKTLKKQNRGFTIIEVVLVLAIAGLIFLIVFMALPRLQRNRRDTQRKGDVGTVLAQLEQRAGNYNGDYPTVGCAGANGDFKQFIQSSYVGGLKDPSTNNTYNCVNSRPAAFGDIQLQKGVKCDGSSASANTVAVRTYLEVLDVFCKDNS